MPHREARRFDLVVGAELAEGGNEPLSGETARGAIVGMRRSCSPHEAQRFRVSKLFSLRVSHKFPT